MKINDYVKLCTENEQLDAVITGEDEDGRSIGYWLVSCQNLVNVAFCKEAIDGRHYRFWSMDSWIIPNGSLEPATELVDGWMDDGSDYDKITYPTIETGLLNMQDPNLMAVFEQSISGIITWEQVEQINQQLEKEGYELAVIHSVEAAYNTPVKALYFSSSSSFNNTTESLSLLVTQAIAIINEVFESDSVSDRKIKTALEILRIFNIGTNTSATSAVTRSDSIAHHEMELNDNSLENIIS